MGHDLLSLRTLTRALPSCCGSKLRRSPYETTANLALPAENGSLQTLALPAPRAIVGDVQPHVPPGRAARAADRARREPSGRIADRRLCGDYDALHHERAATPQPAAAHPGTTRRSCAALLHWRDHQPLP